MIKPVRFKPTIFKISENAQKALKRRQDDDITAFALEVIRTNRTINTPVVKPKNILERLSNILAIKSQMIVTLDEKNGVFLLNTKRIVDGLKFTGKSVAIDLKDIVTRKGAVDEALLESKKEILSQIGYYNGGRKYFEV